MKNNLVKCTNCDLNFLSREGMEKHFKRVHAPKDPANMPRTRFKCENCDEEFSTKLDFKKHREPQKLLCKKCQEDKQKFICENKCELIKHVRRMHKKDLMMKKQNIIESKRLEKLQQKKPLKNFTPRHQCQKCNKVFKDNNFLELHMREEHSGPQIKKERLEVQQRRYTKATPAPTLAPVTKVELAKRPAVPATKEARGISPSLGQPAPPPVSYPPPEPKEQYYYQTFTADELIKLGIFTALSPGLYTLPPATPEPATITGDLAAAEAAPGDQLSLDTEAAEVGEPPNTCEGLFILGL